MRAKLFRVESPGIDDLSIYLPKNKENFSILIEVAVGYEGQKKEGGDIFGFQIYTPQWLISNYSPNEVIIPRHSLIIFEYNYDSIYQRIKKIIESCTGESWDEISQKISRYGYWEFEDYQE